MASQNSRFARKKAGILASLAVPDAEYDDLSPKGSVDAGIRDLIDEINLRDGLVTTSSCAGRVSVFLEGVKKSAAGIEQEPETDENDVDELVPAKLAGAGGKGGGGRWLYVSHDPVDLSSIEDVVSFFGLNGSSQGSLTTESASLERLVHFKFEPMILHILTASVEHAQTVISAAMQAGFRESGALNIAPSGGEGATPMVGIRCNGIALESIIGITSGNEIKPLVGPDHLKALLAIGNERFKENTRRIERFRVLLRDEYEKLTKPKPKKMKANGEEWEDPEVRRRRMREEGLKRSRGEI